MLRTQGWKPPFCKAYGFGWAIVFCKGVGWTWPFVFTKLGARSIVVIQNWIDVIYTIIYSICLRNSCVTGWDTALLVIGQLWWFGTLSHGLVPQSEEIADSILLLFFAAEYTLDPENVFSDNTTILKHTVYGSICDNAGIHWATGAPKNGHYGAVVMVQWLWLTPNGLKTTSDSQGVYFCLRPCDLHDYFLNRTIMPSKMPARVQAKQRCRKISFLPKICN